MPILNYTTKVDVYTTIGAIQGALVKAKVLQNDGWREIADFSDVFCVDKNNPHSTVEIYEVEEAEHERDKNRAIQR